MRPPERRVRLRPTQTSTTVCETNISLSGSSLPRFQCNREDSFLSRRNSLSRARSKDTQRTCRSLSRYPPRNSWHLWRRCFATRWRARENSESPSRCLTFRLNFSRRLNRALTGPCATPLSGRTHRFFSLFSPFSPDLLFPCFLRLRPPPLPSSPRCNLATLPPTQSPRTLLQTFPTVPSPTPSVFLGSILTVSDRTFFASTGRSFVA